METKIPSRFLKPRSLCEIPRSKYMPAPQLEGNDDKSRKSFIALLRKGPSDKFNQKKLPVSVKISCALWLRLSKPISSTVSLILHCKESNDDYCLVLDEATVQGVESLMLSGHAVIRPNSDIEFIRVSCSGLARDYHVLVDELHIESEVVMKPDELYRAG